MAKTLVALYDTFTDAEQVVQELMADGFERNDIHMALDHTKGRATPPASVEWDSAYEGANLTDTLADLGVPYDEAHSYAEGVRRGGALVVVESSDGRADRGMEMLRRMHPVNIHERTAQWRQGGWTGYDANAITSTPTSSTVTTTRRAQEQARSTARVADKGATTRRVEGQEEIAIPVVEEDISIGKREVERGHVRVFSRVTERPVEESVRLREEKVTVERRPVDRPATDADFAAAEKEVLEITETAEEPVVSKRARVVEEVVVQKEVTERTETVRGTERHTDVDVQRGPETATATRRGTVTQDFATYDSVFRQHCATAFAGKGATYTEYEPAYRYGYELGTNERYQGRNWTALEADARRDWEARHPSTWDRFKDAIRYGWESITGNETAQSNLSRTRARDDFTTYSDDFQKHYVTAFGDRGAAYTDYEPAYRYGYELGTNERYRGRDWVALEADARRDWEARHPSTWDRFKDAVRYSWDKVRART
jgi:stress response protein YsnF